MIVSYHPIIAGDMNRICAGREPDGTDARVLQTADRVILSQGCGQKLYEMAQKYCPRVFPNYDHRFGYPGKIGQIRLFRETQTPHPDAICFHTCAAFHAYSGSLFPYPFVFKFNWGGEGETVFRVNDAARLRSLLDQALLFETTGQTGFLIQRYIPAAGRSLRVVVIGSRFLSYWRVAASPDGFYGNLASGGRIDRDSDPDLQQLAVAATGRFCCATGVNLAGIDVIFSSTDHARTPYFLEINYFFGREGIGGSENYYRLLRSEIDIWLNASR